MSLIALHVILAIDQKFVTPQLNLGTGKLQHHDLSWILKKEMKRRTSIDLDYPKNKRFFYFLNILNLT